MDALDHLTAALKAWDTEDLKTATQIRSFMHQMTIRDIESWGHAFLASEVRRIVDYETSAARENARHYMGLATEADREKSL